MSLIDLVLAAEAAECRRAVRRTAYRHVHLAERPLVVVAYNLSGEAAAPLGIMYGTDPDDAKLVVAAEPRNRESRFAAINAFAADFATFVRPYLVLKTVPGKKRGTFKQVTHDAPQIVVPNRSTRSYLGARLGRSLRYLGLGDTHEVPEATQWTGSHLSWLAEHSHLPGQSVFLAMTETLAEHFVTGQSALEDENLATLLAWIDGVPGDVLPALEALETTAYGPVPDPRWEARLEPFVKQYSDGLREDDIAKRDAAFAAVEAAVRPALADAYAATHRAIDVMRTIDPAAGVADRWKTDHNDWTAHAKRAANGIPRFARRHDALRAARTLQRWSSAADSLETDQAFDDPMILARLDAAGRCVSGTVAAIDDTNKEVKPGNQNATKVPLVDIELTSPTRLLPGETVCFAVDRRAKGPIRSIDGDRVVVAVMAGPKALDDSGLAPGDECTFVGHDPWDGANPLSPDEVPWTHKETTSDLAGDVSDDPTAGGDDDSPDMTLAELGDVPVLGPVGPDEEPGVVL